MSAILFYWSSGVALCNIAAMPEDLDKVPNADR